MDNLIEETISNTKVKFKTRPGVFSKRGVDSGTKLLIEHLPELSKGQLVADLGCGSGVMGITIAKKNPEARVHLLDVNLRIIDLARENILENSLKNAEVFLSDQFQAVSNHHYDLIVANPAQHLGNKFLEETARDCLKQLKPGGTVFWVMQKHLKPYVLRLFDRIFTNHTIVAHKNGHIVIRSQKSNVKGQKHK